jgi:hypothetical protein
MGFRVLQKGIEKLEIEKWLFELKIPKPTGYRWVLSDSAFGFRISDVGI